MTEDLETAISEITILPDGRVYVFGMSRQVLEILRSFPTADTRLHRLHEQLQRRPVVALSGDHATTGCVPVAARR